jgi:hypothetical protein
MPDYISKPESPCPMDKVCDRQIEPLNNLNQPKDGFLSFLSTVSHDLRSPAMGNSNTSTS